MSDSEAPTSEISLSPSPSSSSTSSSSMAARKTMPVDDKKPLNSPLADKASMYTAALSSSDRVPAGLKPYIKQIGTVISLLIEFAEVVIPFIESWFKKLEDLWKRLEPYSPELLIPSFIGLVMCFFGGHYLTLIAAVEAYRMIGFSATYAAIRDIIGDLRNLEQANEKDDEEDLDGDGIADVKEVSAGRLAERKALLILRTIDPIRMQHAIVAINSGFLAVVATLKVQFAKAITLGHAIAHAIEVPVHDYLTPHLENALPSDYRKWAKPTVSYIINVIAISIAWTIQRVISAYHSAIRGGTMFSRNIFVYLCVKKYLAINHEETFLDEILGAVVAALGIWFQLANGFSLPFPLNILLFPCTLAEWFLEWVVNTW